MKLLSILSTGRADVRRSIHRRALRRVCRLEFPTPQQNPTIRDPWRFPSVGSRLLPFVPERGRGQFVQRAVFLHREPCPRLDPVATDADTVCPMHPGRMVESPLLPLEGFVAVGWFVQTQEIPSDRDLACAVPRVLRDMHEYFLVEVDGVPRAPLPPRQATKTAGVRRMLSEVLPAMFRIPGNVEGHGEQPPGAVVECVEVGRDVGGLWRVSGSRWITQLRSSPRSGGERCEGLRELTPIVGHDPRSVGSDNRGSFLSREGPSEGIVETMPEAETIRDVACPDPVTGRHDLDPIRSRGSGREIRMSRLTRVVVHGPGDEEDRSDDTDGLRPD